MRGGDGNNIISGDAGSDTLEGGNGDDTINGGDNNDTIRGEVGNDALNGGDGDDLIQGGDGNDTLHGGIGNDRLEAGRGNDTLFGGEGDDLVQGGNDTNVLDGGAGIDTIDYFSSTSGVGVNIGNNAVFGGDAEGDTISNFENINGSNVGADILIGGSGDNVINGLGGADVIEGGDGNDTLNGGDGADILTGGRGNDTLHGGSGQDFYMFRAGDGQDAITSFDDNSDKISLVGFGITAANFANNVRIVKQSSSTFVVEVKNAASANFNGAEMVRMTLTDSGSRAVSAYFHLDAEDFVFHQPQFHGTGVNDVLTGDNAANSIFGYAGNDTLSGGLGNDLIYGGAGNDAISGDAGDDEIWLGTGTDTADGGAGVNRINLSDVGSAVSVNLSSLTNGQVTISTAGGNKTISNFTHVTGTNLADTLIGDAASNNLVGGSGNDVLTGGEGNDFLFGGEHTDTLDGGAGNDVLSGGGQGDQFVFSNGFGNDSITDFDDTADRINLVGFADADDITAANFADRVVITSTADNPMLWTVTVLDGAGNTSGTINLAMTTWAEGNGGVFNFTVADFML